MLPITELPADLQLLLSSPDDLLLIYLHSAEAQKDAVDAFDIGMVLKGYAEEWGERDHQTHTCGGHSCGTHLYISPHHA